MHRFALTAFAALFSFAFLSGVAAGDIAAAAEAVKPLKAGTQAPDVSFKDTEGKEIRLQTLLKQGPVVLVFYRGGWCPFCQTQLKGLAEAAPTLKDEGLQLVAVAPDLPERQLETAKKESLDYTLLSDASMKAAEAFGVAFRVDEGTLEKYKGYGIDLEAASGEKHHALPVPSVFIVGKDGKILFAYSNPDYKVRLSKEDLLKAAKEAAKP